MQSKYRLKTDANFVCSSLNHFKVYSFIVYFVVKSIVVAYTWFSLFNYDTDRYAAKSRIAVIYSTHIYKWTSTQSEQKWGELMFYAIF